LEPRLIFDQARIKSLDGLEALEGTFPNHEDISDLIPKRHFIPGIPFLLEGDLTQGSGAAEVFLGLRT